jgi:hypothetical protein
VGTLRPVLAVVGVAAAVVFSLVGGAGSGAGATTDPCPPASGRQFCVTITDTEPVSASVDGVVAYVLYTISVQNVGGATLTNGVVTTTLKDHVGTTTSKSSAQFIASASTLGCAAVSGPTNTVSCNVGNLAAGQSLASPLQLVYRTSTTTGVGSTDAEVVGSFKEKGNDNQKNDPNPDTRPVVENTPYEPCPDCSYAFSPHDQPVTLATAPDGDTWGSFSFTNRGGGVAARLDETPAASSADHCVSGKTCFGQLIQSQASTVTLGTGEVFAWQTTWSFDIVAKGISDKNVVIVHTLNNGDIEVISKRCSAEPPTAADVAGAGCLVPSIGGTKKAKTLIVHWYATHNGFGRGG